MRGSAMGFADLNTTASRLVSGFGYSDRGAQIVAAKLAVLHPELAGAAEEWWAGKALPQIILQGYTVERLSSERGLSPVAAILTLDWLFRDPVAAKKALDRGHGKIV